MNEFEQNIDIKKLNYILILRDKYKKEIEKKLIKYMLKEYLQQTILELLYDGPEWMYDRFIREKIVY